MATEKKNDRKHEIKDIQLFEEDGKYYLKLKYIIEDEHSVKEVEVPKVKLPFTKDTYPYVRKAIHQGKNIWELPYNECFLELNDLVLPMERGETSESCGCEVFSTEKIIKEKHKKMTVAEIEKKLGYKIEIVSEE